MPPAFARFLGALALVGALTACSSGTTTFGDESADGATGTSVVLTIPEEATTSAPEDASATEEIQTSASTVPFDGEEQKWTEASYMLLNLATVEFPTDLTSRSGGDDLWFTERPGRVRQIQRRTTSDGKEQSYKLMNTVVLDITDKVSTEGEGGLLGLAFSTDGRLLYVNYTNLRGNTVVAEYQMDTITAKVSSERILIEIEQPFANHNGGKIALGPDGFLYIGMGDGGSSGDPLNHGQNTSTLLGSILRIDPLAPTEDRPYGIPVTNPFADGNGGLPETWLYGVRNPWRFSFDRIDGDLWIGDVGQNQLEEITLLRSLGGPAGGGANLGWRIVEGNEPFDGSTVPENLTGPIYTYEHDNGRCSVTGGYVYRGDALRELNRVYVFGDFCSGELFGIELRNDNEIVVADLLLDAPAFSLASFGEDSRGELYVLQGTGEISLLVREGAGLSTRVLGPNEQYFVGRTDDAVEPTNGTGTTTSTTVG